MKQPFLFESENFGFRLVAENDFEYFQMLDADPEIMSFFPSGIRSTQEIQDKIKKYVAGYKKNCYGVFLVFDLTSREFIGRAGFDDIESGETEVGYVLLKKYWGKGFASQILKALLTWAKIIFTKIR